MASSMSAGLGQQQLVINVDSYLPTQYAEINAEADSILDDFMEPLVNATIIREIQVLCDAANIPEGFKSGVKFVRTSPNTGEVINTWGTPEKPLAIWFNYGTKRHWVEPIFSSALSWLYKSGSHGNAIYFQGDAQPGDRLYSKGHYVSGVPKTEVMERGFAAGIKRLAVEAARVLEAHLGK